MNGQALDLRGFLAALRRRLPLVVVLVLLGGAAGAGTAVARPPAYSSTSQVLLPPPAQDAGGQTTQRDIETYVQVTRSEAVLGGVARSLGTSTRRLAKRLVVSAPTADVVEVRARASAPRGAESLARAVARGLVTYLARPASSSGSARSTALDQQLATLRSTLADVRTQVAATRTRLSSGASGASGAADATALAQLTSRQAALVLQVAQTTQERSDAGSAGDTADSTDSTGGSTGGTGEAGVSATVIQAASPATRSALVRHDAVLVGGGLLAGLVLAALWVALRSRRDRRLYARDALADALGSPVLASLDSSGPRSAGDWLDLLADYAPSTVDAWALRQVVRGIEREAARSGSRASVLVLALSDDSRGLAVGPRLASYAASTGTHTRLLAAQRHDSATPLWAALGRTEHEGELRPGLQVASQPSSAADPGAGLDVVVAVLDRRDPQLEALPRTTTTLLALAAGTTTLEELSRLAVRADDAGHPVEGLLVADPDELDHTTGRLSRTERSHQVALPIRLTGGPSTTRAATSTSTHTSGPTSIGGPVPSGLASPPASRRSH